LGIVNNSRGKCLPFSENLPVYQKIKAAAIAILLPLSGDAGSSWIDFLSKLRSPAVRRGMHYAEAHAVQRGYAALP
jgi:hypothetical protein